MWSTAILCFWRFSSRSTPDMGAEASPLESAHEPAEAGAAAAAAGGREGGTGVAFVVDAEASGGMHCACSGALVLSLWTPAALLPAVERFPPRDLW